MPIRPRRNRRSAAIRSLIRETDLGPNRLIYPLFVMEGRDEAEPIDSMPGQARLTIDRLVAESRAAHALGVPAVALFPAVDDALKDRTATGALDPDGLVQRAVRELKSALPELLVITDVAMDPYSSDGHDGLVEDGESRQRPDARDPRRHRGRPGRSRRRRHRPLGHDGRPRAGDPHRA